MLYRLLGVGHGVGLVVHEVGLGVHVGAPEGRGEALMGVLWVGQLVAGWVVESRVQHCRGWFRCHSWYNG